MDCEDSVAAVDAEDKVAAYRNWLGLMKGDLTATVEKGGDSFERRLNPDLDYHRAGRHDRRPYAAASLMLVRNVGHLMTSPAILDARGRARSPRGSWTRWSPALIALHDVGPAGRRANSPAGSVYIVKPKMHGPEEVAFAVELFGRVEAALGMAPNTLKIGIMDEERRTTRQPQGVHPRGARAGGLHQHRLPRPHRRRDPHRDGGGAGDPEGGDAAAPPGTRPTRTATSTSGSPAACPGRAQIGKGMWAAPDLMAAMLAEKGAQPAAGANTAWVPSPTAATLHATHYHRVDVAEAQARARRRGGRARLDGHPDAAGGDAAELVGRGGAARARQQRPGHPRLRGALDRPGRRLLEGARHPRRRR